MVTHMTSKIWSSAGLRPVRFSFKFLDSSEIVEAGFDVCFVMFAIVIAPMIIARRCLLSEFL